MGTKSVDYRYVERVAGLVKSEVDTKYQGNQRMAARHMPLSQTQISDYYSLKPGKGLGLPVLLKLRDYFNRSLDDLLGLDPLPSEKLMNQIRASVEALMGGKSLPQKGQPLPVIPPDQLPEGVTPIAPPGATKKSSQANAQSRASSRKQNREAEETRAAEVTRTIRRHKKGKTG